MVKVMLLIDGICAEKLPFALCVEYDVEPIELPKSDK